MTRLISAVCPTIYLVLGGSENRLINAFLEGISAKSKANNFFQVLNSGRKFDNRFAKRVLTHKYTYAHTCVASESGCTIS